MKLYWWILRPVSRCNYPSGSDVARIMDLGGNTMEDEECFSRVLQGNIDIDSAVFLENGTKFVVHRLARGPLWTMNLDGRHGTELGT